MALLKCLPCGRTGDEVGRCGSFMTCPKQGVPIEPTDIVLSCDRCGITRVVAAGRVMQGKPLEATSMCPVETCEARAIFLTNVEPATMPSEPLATKAANRGERNPKGK